MKGLAFETVLRAMTRDERARALLGLAIALKAAGMEKQDSYSKVLKAWRRRITQQRKGV